MARSKNVDASAVEAEVIRIQNMTKYDLIVLWRRTFRTNPPRGFTKGLIGRYLAYHVQEKAFGGLDRATKRFLDGLALGREPGTPRPRRLKSGTVVVREYQGERHTVTIGTDGFIWRERTYKSLSAIAREITGKAWNGPRFFGVRITDGDKRGPQVTADATRAADPKPKAHPKVRHRQSRISLEGRL
jgi:Protein of unknown function (DUF2924)